MKLPDLDESRPIDRRDYLGIQRQFINRKIEDVEVSLKEAGGCRLADYSPIIEPVWACAR